MNTPKHKALKVSTLALSGAIAATLILGGCGDKNKTKTSKAATSIEKIEARKVSDAEGLQALAAFSLAKSGSGDLQWDKRNGSAGNYTFSDITINSKEDAAVAIGQIEVWGAHMAGEQASFDKIEFRDFSARKEDDTDVTIATIALVKPSPALASGLAKAFGGDKDAFDNIEGDIGFQAISFTGFNLTDDDVNMNIKSVSMGETKDKTGVFSLQGFTLDAQNDDGKKGNVKMSLGAFDVTGANLKKYKGIIAEAMKNGGNDGKLNEKAMANLMKSMNVYDPDFKTASIRDFALNAEGMTITMKSFDASADKKDGKVTMVQEMSPLKIVAPKDSKDPGLQKFTESLASMGYDSLEFTMGGKSILDEEADTMQSFDTYIALKDGFRLSYDFDLTGYKAFAEKTASLSAQGSGQNPMAAMDMMSALQFNQLRISLRDDSIVDRGFKFAAEQQGGTADSLKTQAKAMLGFATMMAQDEAQQKLAAELVAALTTLIDNGGTLTIEMNPEKPANLGSIAMGGMGGNLDVKALGLSVKTE